MNEIYLDNAATTACTVEVAEAVKQAMLTDYGNPSSLHRKGIEAESHLRTATETFAKILHCKEKEIYYTSGGTESNNTALFGAARAYARTGKHIVTTAVEHPSVSEAVRQLQEEGFAVTVLPVDHRGIVAPEEVAAAVREDTILVSVMMVNNELGTVEPIAEIGKAIRKVNPQIVFHTDAVQAFGKLPVRPADLQVDLLSVSAHKIHGPKGVGLLYVREGTKIRPLLLGGGQQRGYRSGTDNVPGIAGFAVAASQSEARREDAWKNACACGEACRSGLEKIEEVRILSPQGADVCSPFILNVAFPGVRSEVLLHTLEEQGIYVSSGSACSSHKRAPSAVLTAIGRKPDEIESAIRFSFSGETTEEEIARMVAVVQEAVPRLRRFSRK